MKLFRFGLSIWITVASIGSFLIGWVALAHSPKPVQHTQQVIISSAAPLPTLTPLQSLPFGGTDNSNNNFPLFQAPSSNFNSGFSSAPQPLFRTGGS